MGTGGNAMTTKTPSRLTPGQAARERWISSQGESEKAQWDAIAAAAIEASPELRRLRERLAVAQSQAASGSELLVESRAENERLRLRVAELEQKLQLAANNLLFPPHSEEP
jgi:hypothetical protein